MPGGFPPIDRDALLARLEQGGAGAITVLTPNQRLARSLEREIDAIHVAAGRSHWEAADVISFSAFLKRSHEEALYSAAGDDVPALLSDSAARVLWEDAVRASPWEGQLLSVAGTAGLAAEAWDLAHAWRIEGTLRTEKGSEDAEAFAQWADHYAKRTARDAFTDTARLAAVVAPLIASGAIARPATLVLYAFDLLNSRQQDFLSACEKAGVEIRRCDAPATACRVVRTVAESPRLELEHAARWARSRLESAGSGRAPRIGVVVPELAERRREAARMFSRVFVPQGIRPGESRAPLFNISLGEPLDAWPLVDAALALLEVASGAVPYDRASRLLRSPFIEGGESEAAERAQLDAALRKTAPASLTLKGLRIAISQAARAADAPACRILLRVLDRVIDAAGETSRAPAPDWARRFTAILDAAGFPGERTLDSVEYQTLRKWRESLGELAALGLVAGAWSDFDARARLRHLCADTVFQPESGDAPVQVLGLLESAGLQFDHLWVSGLTEDAWPIAARPHPLIPPAVQRKAGIPQATPEAALEVDRRITAAWKGAAPEVVFSSARADGDRELLPSPLVADIAASEIEVPPYPQLREVLFQAGRAKGAFTLRTDDVGPALPGGGAKGGTRILVDQAACPFRAFAHYRLDARELERPEHGLGPLERGTMLHEMMARIWEKLGGQRALVATDAATLAAYIDEAARHAIAEVQRGRPGRLAGRFAELERERLSKVARDWLEIEKGRPPFEVVAREERQKLLAGPVQIDGRIDRMDRLEGGGLAVIDYKSGRVSVGDWMGERPGDAQLPLYALTPAEDVRVVTFARLKTGELGFAGVSRDKVGIAGVTEVEKHNIARKYVPSWPALLAMWREQVDKLGEGFAGGHALVDPKEMLRTCDRCDLKSMCRVHERLGPLDTGEDAPEDPLAEESE